MKLFNSNYSKLLLTTILIYFFVLIFIRIINVYTLILIILLCFILYYKDKKLFKKILYKIIFKDKIKRLSFKNKISAATLSLNSISEINNKINDKVKFELLNYEKNLLASQLKKGEYNVTLFGAGSSGKTSIARSLLKTIIGKTSPTIGTTKELTSYKIRIPILKRNINIIDTPGLFEPSKAGYEREKQTIL